MNATSSDGVSTTTTTTTTATMQAEAEELLREGRVEDALAIALQALGTLQATTGQNTTTTTPPTTTPAALPLLNLIASTYLELGDLPTARSYFLRAVDLDPSGQIPEAQGGGADKFLWLAQLSEAGGRDSVRWFERGAAVLQRSIDALENDDDYSNNDNNNDNNAALRIKLASALCGIIEVYMTDLSWDATAEPSCDRLIADALLAAPRSPEPLQTLASVRISQGRVDEARQALRDSMAVWRGSGEEEEEEEEEDAAAADDDSAATSVPDFPTRISLARLLMEVGLEEDALGVVERLVLEDDGSVEAWYLGGWCLYLLGAGGREGRGGEGRGGDGGGGNVEGMEHGNEDANAKTSQQETLSTPSLLSSRQWLRQSLALYEGVGYEDERLRDHAVELVREIDAVVGDEEDDEGEGADEEDDEEEDEEGEEWNGFGKDGGEEEKEEEEQEDEDEDQEMIDQG